MKRSRGRALSLVAVATCAVVAVGAGVALHAGADDAREVVTSDWSVLPKDTVGHGFLATDPASRMGIAFSATADNGVWTRAQAIGLDSGKPLAAPASIVAFTTRAPLFVDHRRHVFIYADTYGNGTTAPRSSSLIGLAVRGGKVTQVFSVTSPLGYLRVAGLGADESGNDLIVVGTADGAGQGLVSGASAVQVQRMSLDSLLAGKADTRWTSPVQLPAGVCASLIQTTQPAGVLFAHGNLYLGCRGNGTFVSNFINPLNNGSVNGVLEVKGLTPTGSPTVTGRMYRMPGNYVLAGESIPAPGSRRFVLVESGYVGLRVFDTDHDRFVGKINAGSQSLFGTAIDEHTSRAYFVSIDSSIGLGDGDVGALVPTQGERYPTPFAAWVSQGNARRLSFDENARRLFVPLRKIDESGVPHEVILAARDMSEPYRPPAAIDYAAGALDTVDREGVTDSAIAATAQAFGADYQLIGGPANLFQNVTGVDTRGALGPGTRLLRQSYVSGASLTGDGAVAYAVTAHEDTNTDGNRHTAGAGDTFAPQAECSDFGVAKTESSKPGASVTCDLTHDYVHATASFDAHRGLFITSTASDTPVASPVQTSRSSVEVTEQRGAGRGVLTTTLSATADGVSIADVVRIGRVTQTAVVTSHGRSGTSKVTREVVVHDVSVNGQRVCGTNCPLQQVVDAINSAMNGRFTVDFPAAQLTAAKRGTYAELTQDPWYHAERTLDFGRASDDYPVPAMSVIALVDGASTSRLVADFAAVSGTASYRIFPLDSGFGGGDDSSSGAGGGTITTPGRPGTGTAGAPGTTTSTKTGGTTPAVATPGAVPGPIGAVIAGVRLGIRSLGDAFPLLLIWALLGVPAYLSARRRLLLELPMLTRDKESV
jgi:hypothetical protein